MSCNVLVIAEDFRTDRYILQPVVTSMLVAAGRPRARVTVMTDPLLGGVAQALDATRLAAVVDRYRLVDVFLLVVDRDGRPGRRDALDAREDELRELLGPDRTLIGQEAWQEVEVWGLAGQDLPSRWRWSEVRDEPHPKERFFEPHVRDRGIATSMGGGRHQVGREAGRRYDRARSRCEDVRMLEERVARWIASR